MDELAKYIDLLSRHDWFYEFADHHSVWSQGREDFAQLNKLREKLDPDFKIWNEYAPSGFRHKESEDDPGTATVD